MAFNPHNYIDPNPTYRYYNGEYYLYTPTKTQSYDWGSVGTGGTVEKLTPEQVKSYRLNQNNTFTAAIDPVTFANRAGWTQQDFQSGIQNAFGGFDPNNTTGWQAKSNDLISQAQTLYNQDPTRGDKVFGDVWNTFRNNNPQEIQKLQAQNNPSRPEFTSQTQAGVYGATGQLMNPQQIQNFSMGQNPNSVLPNNNRSLISTTPKTGYIKGYDTNNGYQEVYVPKGVYVPGISATPKQITSASLQGASTTQLPGVAPTGINQAGAMVAGAGTTIAEIMKSLTPPQTEADIKQQSLLDQMASLVGEQANKAADQLTAEQSAGVPQLKEQFAKINAQILSKVAEYNALNADLEGKPISMASIIGAQAQVTRVKAAEIGLLQAQAQGLQGQIEVAQETANRAVDLKYSVISAKLDVYQTQLNALTPTLNREEKQQQMAQQILLDRQKQALQDAKDEEKSIQSLMLKAMESGITDTKILNKISNSKSYNEALGIATPAIAKTVQTEKDLDNQYKQMQIANIRSEIANRGRSSSGGQYDPSEILAYAQQFASTGQIPTNLPKGSFGLVAQVAKEVPKANGTLVNSITGIKDSKLGATEEGDLRKLYNITQNIKELAELDKKRIGGLIPGALGKVFGSNAQAEYLTKRKAIVDDIQRMQSGAALTETEQKFYKDYLPSRFSEALFLGQDSGKKIQNFAKEMNTKLNNALKTNNLSIYGFSQVKVGDQIYTVGDIISNGTQSARVNPDGTLTLIQ